jgi:hypothetical protein
VYHPRLRDLQYRPVGLRIDALPAFVGFVLREDFHVCKLALTFLVHRSAVPEARNVGRRSALADLVADPLAALFEVFYRPPVLISCSGVSRTAQCLPCNCIDTHCILTEFTAEVAAAPAGGPPTRLTARVAVLSTCTTSL